MKYLILIGLFLFFYLANARVNAQEPGPVSLGASQMAVMIDPYWKSNTREAGLCWEKLTGVAGTMFYAEDWQDGYVLLEDGRKVQHVPLRFNIYGNEIYFRIDSQVLVIDPVLPVREFGLSISQGLAIGSLIIFRRGYPAVDKNTAGTFYQLVANGRLSLLKHYVKRIGQRNNMTTGPRKVFTDTETWYVYDCTDNKMTGIERTKIGLVQAFPQYAESIGKTIKLKGLRLKTDEDWVILFAEMKYPVL